MVQLKYVFRTACSVSSHNYTHPGNQQWSIPDYRGWNLMQHHRPYMIVGYAPLQHLGLLPVVI